MRIFKKIIIISIILIMLVYSIIPPKTTYASVEVDNVGNAIASMAEDWVYNRASETAYSLDFSHREEAYKGIKVEINGESKYRMDCVGFVSVVVHEATGLGKDTFSYFSAPVNSNAVNGVGSDARNDLMSIEAKDNDPKRGDILVYGGHVAIFLGDIDGDGVNEVAHSEGPEDRCSYINR